MFKDAYKYMSYEEFKNKNLLYNIIQAVLIVLLYMLPFIYLMFQHVFVVKNSYVLIASGSIASSFLLRVILNLIKDKFLYHKEFKYNLFTHLIFKNTLLDFSEYQYYPEFRNLNLDTRISNKLNIKYLYKSISSEYLTKMIEKTIAKEKVKNSDAFKQSEEQVRFSIIDHLNIEIMKELPDNFKLLVDDFVYSNTLLNIDGQINYLKEVYNVSNRNELKNGYHLKYVITKQDILDIMSCSKEEALIKRLDLYLDYCKKPKQKEELSKFDNLDDFKDVYNELGGN